MIRFQNRLIFQKTYIWFGIIIALLITSCGETPDLTQIPVVTSTKITVPKTHTPAPSPTATQQPTSLLGVIPEDLRDLSLAYWYPWTGKKEVWILNAVQEFNRTNQYGIRVEANRQNKIFLNITEALSTGTPPDIVNALPYQIAALDIPNEQMLDLTLYSSDPVFGYPQEELDDFIPVALESSERGEKLLGFPMHLNTQLLFYNLTWAGELGFEHPPATPEEFQEQACTAATANLQDEDLENDGTGGWLVDTSAQTSISWMYAFGGPVASKTGYLFETQETVKAFTFLKSLFDDGCAWFAGNPYPNTTFATRLGLFATSGIAGLPFQIAAFEETGSEDEWTAIPFPGNSGEPTLLISSPLFAVVQSSPERQLAAWLFIQWMLTKDNQVQWIEASGYYPSRYSALRKSNEVSIDQPQWKTIQPFIPAGKTIPNFASWEIVQWVVEDATTNLFEAIVAAEDIPNVVRMLDETAAELHGETQ